MRRGLLLGAAGLSLGLAAFVLAVVMSAAPRSGITRTNAACVQPGMTQADVQAVLGGPPVVTAPGGRDWSTLLHETPTRHRQELWGGDEGAALIRFDDQNRVVQVRWFDAPETFLGRVSRLLPF